MTWSGLAAAIFGAAGGRWVHAMLVAVLLEIAERRPNEAAGLASGLAAARTRSAWVHGARFAFVAVRL